MTSAVSVANYLRRQGSQCNKQQPVVPVAGTELLKAADAIEELNAALVRREARAEECPIDRPRCVSKPPETCPRCNATKSQSCFVKMDADYRLVSDVRDIIAKLGDVA